MAKIQNNIFLRGLTGSLGDQFVIRRDRAGRTIIANKPVFDENREFTESQKSHHNAFRQATTYARFAREQEVYVLKAAGTPQTPYNVAVADWFHAPQVLEIDTSGFTGKKGQVIRIRAVDDVMVTHVSVVIHGDNNAALEEGEALPSQQDKTLWIYTAKSDTPTASIARVSATAEDLPGHHQRMTVSL